MADVTSLTDFFVQVSEDEALFARYKKNPEEVMKQHGLSPEAIQAIITADLKAIRRMLLVHGPHPIIIVVFPRP
ncbi:MAG: hypothetical protein WAN87_05875 [Thermoplasmata archaeon]